jgi:hypothetical protein
MKRIIFILLAFVSLNVSAQIKPHLPVASKGYYIQYDMFRARRVLGIPYTASTTPTLNGVIDSVGFGFQLLSNYYLTVSKGLSGGYAEYTPKSYNDATYAPISGSALYIRNGTTSQTSASFNVDGTGRVQTSLTVGTTGTNTFGAFYVDGAVAGGSRPITWGNSTVTGRKYSWGIDVNGFAILYDNTSATARFTMNTTGNATFSGNVTAQIPAQGTVATNYITASSTGNGTFQSRSLAQVLADIAAAPLASPVFTTQITTPLLKISALNTAPATATSTGTLGEIRITATFIYVCTATNTWVRAALATW